MMKKSLNNQPRNALYRFQRFNLLGPVQQDADYPFVDWNFSGTTEEELPH